SSKSPATTQAAASSPSGGKPTLLVYSAQGYSPNGVKAFEGETGVPTKLVEDSTGPLLARIQAEKSNPQWGLLWVDGNEAFAQLDNEGLLKKNLTVPALSTTGQSLVPSDKSFVPTGLTTACTMIYDSKTVTSPPTSWQQLLESKWAGKIGMNNPAVSGPTFPCVAGLMNYLGGVPAGEAFLRKLKSNGLHVSEANSDTLHLLETGQIQIGLIQSSAAIGAAAKVPGLKVGYLPKETLLPSVIGVDSKTPPVVQEEAQKFLTWVLSPAGQHQMQTGDPHGDSLYWPVVAGTKPLALLPELSTLSTQTIDPSTWGAREAKINNWFNANIAQ
ncbi:MAG TPA: extracellular solute-binding protein, partial [Solirubrobacteraceae bacterium]|nr:extracellular solute-binding protein [Solirubrobacteraceae bacterium]